MFLNRLALSAALILSAAAHAHPFFVGNLVIDHLWSRPTTTGMPTGVAYLSITNKGPQEDELIAAHTPVAARVEFHRTSLEQGMARMRPAGALLVPPGSTLIAEPGGLHLMLVDLKSPLIAGTTLPLVLKFRIAGEITVSLRVAPHDTAASSGGTAP